MNTSWAMEFDNTPIIRSALKRVSSQLLGENGSGIWTRYGKDRVLVFITRQYGSWLYIIAPLVVSLVFAFLNWVIPAIIMLGVICLAAYVHTGHFNYTIFRWSVERSGYTGKGKYFGESRGYRRFILWGKT